MLTSVTFWTAGGNFFYWVIRCAISNWRAGYCFTKYCTILNIMMFIKTEVIIYQQLAIYLASAFLTFYNSKFGKIRIPFITILVGDAIFCTSSCMKYLSNIIKHPRIKFTISCSYLLVA